VRPESSVLAASAEPLSDCAAAGARTRDGAHGRTPVITPRCAARPIGIHCRWTSSRALDAVDLDALRRCASWLLTVFTGVDTVILSPAAMTYVRLSTTIHPIPPNTSLLSGSCPV